MKNKNLKRKGFTIVELVIVIAVIAILAAILIPTFVSVTKKANIANDTAVARNLNTSAIAAQADTFDEAIIAAKEYGYLVANLNAKADGCFFVWEDETNQFLLYNLNEKEIIYSNTKNIGEPNENWYFAINNAEDEGKIKDVWSNVNIKILVSNVAEIIDLINNGGIVYIDESVVLDDENLIHLNTNTNTTLNLVNSSLNTDGMLTGGIPILVENGTLNINGGTIGAAGEYIDDDGKLVNTPIEVLEGAKLYIDGTTFNIQKSGYITIMGEAVISNAKFNSKGTTIYSGTNGKVTLENVTVNSSERYLWSTNWDGVSHNTGTAVIIVNSGKFEGDNNSSDFAPVSAYSGDIVINGGEFSSNREDETIFQVMYNNGTITINGGTFNGIAFEDLTIDEIQDLTFQGKVYQTEDGKGFIIKYN